MFITDLTHFLDGKGAIAPQIGPARRLAEFLGSVVAAASAQERGVATEPVLCRNKKCKWPITSTIAPDDTVEWVCAKCAEEGRITNWRHSFWDLSEGR